MKFPDCLEDAADCFAVGRVDLWPPDLEQQYDPFLISFVLRFVVDRIIEQKGLPLLPAARFTAHTEPAVRRGLDRNVADQPGVSIPV